MYLAQLYLDQNNIAAADAELRRAVELDPRNPRARAGLGMVFRRQQDCKDALMEYAKAISLASNLEGVHYEMGLCYLQLGQVDDAIAALRAELQTNGEDRDTEMALASAYDLKGMKQEADDARTK